MENPAISIIVPIFNMEWCMRKCIDSILAQTFTDFECLLIDDGSTDNSGKICDDYAEKDKRIFAIHKQNGGVSSARQCGIDHAQGEYTIHADPDDWVEPNMLYDLFEKAKETDADMVICDFYINTYKGQEYIKQKPSSLNHKEVLHDVFGKIHGSTCNKLIKRSLYSDYNIQFPKEISFCEDQYVIAAILKHDIKVTYLPQAFYHYIRELNQVSLSRNYNEKTYQKDLLRRNLFDELLKDETFRQEVYDKNTYSIISRAFYHGFNYYTSKNFEKQFHPHIDLVKKAKVSKTEKYLILWSCRGFYKTSIFILNFLLQIKHKLC